jgi:hypothetical protein
MNNPILETLRNPRTIRLQALRILELAKANKSPHFILDSEQMTSTASFVLEVMMNQYPDLIIPYHSRWRHFEAGGVDRIGALQEQLSDKTTEERGKILYELVIISVFLDAGAGNSWCYIENDTGNKYSRSEGLALASLSMYHQGIFSVDPKNPLRVDAKALLELNEDTFRKGFQVSALNPLEGLSGRVALLNRLGTLLESNTDYFGEEKRLGNFYSAICAQIQDNTLSAETLFRDVLDAFHAVWPERVVFQGHSLGDVGIHSALNTDELGSDFIPFHKLSQWMTYSLIEPLEQSGVTITNLDQLTGLPEYRNGGLLIDCGVLQLKDKENLFKPHEPYSELIIEWRALTVALLDELALLIRQKLHKNASTLPLAKILQGGTWEAGRRIAKQKRQDGSPPLHIISDGTVF